MSEAYIYTIGGAQRLLDLTPFVSDADWGLSLDGLGSAQVSLLATDEADTALLATEPWLHELHILEEGVTVFQGPVLYVLIPQNRKTNGSIIAQDVVGWMTVRLLHKVMDYASVQGKTILRDIVNTALAPPVLPWSQGLEPNVLQFVKIFGETESGITWAGGGSCRVEVPYGHSAPRSVAWDKIKANLGNEAHMSVHGRRINFWPYNTYLPNADLPRVDADSFDDFPPLVKDGDTLATYVSIPCRDVTMRYFPTTAGTRLAAASTTFPAQPWTNYFGGIESNYTGYDPTSENRGMFLLKADDIIANGTSIVTYPSDIIFPSGAQSLTLSAGLLAAIADGFRFTALDGYSSYKALQPGTGLLVERVMPRPGARGWTFYPGILYTPPWADTIADTSRVETSLVRSISSGGGNDITLQLGCDHPWRSEMLVCGAKAIVSTRFKEYNLQVHSINGKWGGQVTVRLADLGGPPHWATDPGVVDTVFQDRPDLTPSPDLVLDTGATVSDPDTAGATRGTASDSPEPASRIITRA